MFHFHFVKELLDDLRWHKLVTQFREENYKLFQFNTTPVLTLTLEAGLAAMKTPYPCLIVTRYCIRGYFRGGFIYANFASQSSQRFPLQYTAIYSNENIPKTVKLSHREFPHLHVCQNCENICTRNIWRIQ